MHKQTPAIPTHGIEIRTDGYLIFVYYAPRRSGLVAHIETPDGHAFRKPIASTDELREYGWMA